MIAAILAVLWQFLLLGVNDVAVIRDPSGRFYDIYTSPGLYFVPSGYSVERKSMDRSGYALPDWDEAAGLAILWDRECDRARETMSPLTEESLERAVAYASWQARSEGFRLADWPLEKFSIANLGDDASRVAGRYYPSKRELEINIRYLDGWDWSDSPSWGVIYHEVAHSSGVLNEELTQIAMLEMLAGSANDGILEAKVALVCELRHIAIGYLRYMAAAPAFMPHDQSIGYLVTASRIIPSNLDPINAMLRAVYVSSLNQKMLELERVLYQTEEQWVGLQRRKRQLRVEYPDERELLRVRLVYDAIPFGYVWRAMKGEVAPTLSYLSEGYGVRQFSLDDLAWFLYWNYGLGSGR